jgi:phage gp29-like protein
MASSRILGPDGQPIQYDVLKEEIAVGAMTGIRQVWHPSEANSLTPSRLATILSDAAQGEATAYLTLAEEMEERDLHYASVLGTRKLALAGLEVRVDALSDSGKDVQIADAVREMIAAPIFEDAVFDLTDALGKGYSVVEVIWDSSGRVWTPKALEHRDPRWFRFDRETGRELRLLDDAAPFDGLPLAPYKFIVHQPRIRSGLPIRGGLARLAAPGYMCKAWSWKDWMAFADIFGLPMRVGRYGPGASKEDINKLMTAVANLGSDAAAVLPESTRIEFEQAANVAGAADFFERLASWWDKQISKGVLGQTMTADDGSSMSQAKVHNEVRLDLLQADAKALQNTLNRSLIRPFVDLNFGPGHYPKLVVVVPEPEDTKGLVDMIAKLVPMGLQVEQSIVRDKLGLPDPDKKATLLRAPGAAVTPEPPALQTAANAENLRLPPEKPDYVDTLVDVLGARTESITGQWIERIRAEVSAASDMDDLLGRLSALLTDLPLEELGELIAGASGAADRAARADTEDEFRA